ncbi:MAG: transcriptional regulator, family [Herbinix sp.]|jgi:flagellar biosynthesis component FlhA|nr:transcriptional regulator, family [Herbinix sp.]
MEGKNFGSRLSTARKEKGITQEQLASRLGVTPQAVSKWERGGGYPDIELVYYLCEILGCSSDYIIGLEEQNTKLTEDNDAAAAKKLLDKVLAEPLVIEAGIGFVDLLMNEYKNQFPSIRSLRENMAEQYGVLLPVLRIRDNERMNPLEYRIQAYDQILYSITLESMEGVTFADICRQLEETVLIRFDKIMNRQMLQTLLDNVATRYPAAITGVIPDKLSLSLVQAVLCGLVVRKKSIRNLVKIIEILEDEIGNTCDAAQLTLLVQTKLDF